MSINHPNDCLPSEITPRELFEQRRKFLKYSISSGLGLALPWAGMANAASEAVAEPRIKIPGVRPSTYSTTEKPNKYEHITTYNNFYEFGTEKTDPAERASRMRIRPWTVTIEGLVKKPKLIGIDDIMKLAPLEERIYRLRCVEGWSMVIPWVGYPLSALLKQVEPLGSAKYVQFESSYQPDTMEGGGIFGRPVLNWPYVEGLRLDEAMHPLTIVGVGLYGELLQKQNGAPVRVVVPWKYGFKSAKSIVKIRFVEQEPPTSWNRANSREYGFYSNVNPEVDHPRWSQATERRLGELLKRKTLMFNGYGEQVASMYKGMDLRKYY
ncbi:exported heme-molybdoenzyme molybdopterin-containing subunit YedY; TAT export [Georgfuchsia toluolica]|uniref:Protein-methionine-sulfoxide reductase catalytic subunit MsrP n=1 Tax=Georgfuchsia toluolica TaxID=424218 RepID=A0A916J4Y0_9PROT|nr:protein-methionine-sulfoxide reductase catalytic subunit MsrP [Georgfuchsia toluolica]CAG4884041.1 exported heme-molybdoenzyme molybdopterin-containing subunit YedY; TAT export [Georgfuchsia toluolica]